MSNRDIYKDEFGQYHEVEEETEESVDGMEDDEVELFEDEDDLFDSGEDSSDDYYDEDEEYANDRHVEEYDVDED